MTLSKEERAALVEALANDGNVTGCTGRLLELELVEAGTWLRLALTPVDSRSSGRLNGCKCLVLRVQVRADLG